LDKILTELPKSLKFKERIEWKNTIGTDINILYKDVVHSLKVIDYNRNKKQFLTVKIDDDVKTTDFCTNNLIYNKFNIIFEHGKTHEYLYSVGDKIKTNTGEIEILSKTYKILSKKENKHKAYKYRCTIDGYEDIITEGNLKQGKGCSVCKGGVVKAGVNDIGTTDIWMLDYLLDKDDAFKYSIGSSKLIKCKCPICGYKKEIKADTIKFHGYGCPICSDHISFGEKLIINLLIELDIDFKKEKTFKWSKNIFSQNDKLKGSKRYDFYVNSLNTIIEAHGKQHYSSNFCYKDSKSLKEEKENDKIKEEIAKENGIKNYIIIDCRISDLDFIKSNIIDSKLNELFDLSNIDWNKILLLAKGNLLISTCNLYAEGLTSTQISNKLKIGKTGILSYLRRGTDLGMCDYDAKEEMRKSATRNRNTSVKVVCELNGVKKYFESIISVTNSLYFEDLSYKMAQSILTKQKPYSPIKRYSKKFGHLKGLTIKKITNGVDTI